MAAIAMNRFPILMASELLMLVLVVRAEVGHHPKIQDCQALPAEMAEPVQMEELAAMVELAA